MTSYQLADLWETLADAAGDTEVLVAGPVRASYRQLDERATRLANHLAAAGVRAGDHVGLYSYNRAEFVETLLAAYKLRAVPININYRYVESELRYVLADSGVVAMVYERQFAPLLSGLAPEFPAMTAYVEIAEDPAEAPEPAVAAAVRYEDALRSASPERGFGPRSPDDIYIIYTGGTTGMPKGTMWRHEDIFFGAMGGGTWSGGTVSAPEDIAGNATVGFRMTFGVLAPLMHGAAQWLLLGGLLSGARVAVYTGRRFDAGAVLRMAERERATSLAVVGDAMARPLAAAAASGTYDLSALLGIGSGGAVLSDAVKAELVAAVPHLTVRDTYGSSEMGAGTSSAAGASGARFVLRDDLAVLDETSWKPVEPGSGQVGRIARRGHIPIGYWKDPEKTARTFVTVDGVRWSVPGDFGLVEADGTLVLLGRGSQCINTGGEKVYPEEVEAAIKAHPSVFDAVVVGVPDERWGERVVAVVATRDGGPLELADLDTHCRALVAGYKVPRELVLRQEIRRTNVGKVDYAWAREAATAAAAAPAAPAAS